MNNESGEAGQVPSVWEHPFMNDDPYKKEREKREAAGQVPPQSNIEQAEALAVRLRELLPHGWSEEDDFQVAEFLEDQLSAAEARGYTAALERLRNPSEEVLIALEYGYCSYGDARCVTRCGGKCRLADEHDRAAIRAALRAAVDMVGRKG